MKEVRLLFEEIDNMAEWVRESEIGDMKIGYLPLGNPKSFNASTARENGKFRKSGNDKFAKHWVNAEQNRVAIRVMTFTEYKQAKRDKTKLEIYVKELPEGFSDPNEYWEVGAYYS